jgi:hypothetical protein
MAARPTQLSAEHERCFAVLITCTDD